MDKYGCWKKYKYRNDFYRYFNAIARRVGIKYSMKGHFNRSAIGLAQTQELISDMILTGRPALVTRFGSNEANIIAQTIGIDLQVIKHYAKVDLININRNAGVFPYGHEMSHRFGRISIDAMQSIDLIGAWNSYMQDYLINEECPQNMAVTMLGDLEPFFSDKPWTTALRGKKVLVIHPFKETIENQYKNREKLFANPDMLPEFELITMKAVQTIAHEMDPRFSNWEEALNYMYEAAMKHDFDVALLGCGAYGMPLAAKIKERGKTAIHLGGALQLLFGIKGKRWDDMPQGKLYNEYWVRPLENERPRKAQSVEGACYW